MTEPPTPDGRLILSLPSPQGYAYDLVIPFAFMRHHAVDSVGLTVQYENSREFYPGFHVFQYTAIFNSDVYLEKLNAWVEEMHIVHLDTEPHPLCYRCAEDASPPPFFDNSGVHNDHT